MPRIFLSLLLIILSSHAWSNATLDGIRLSSSEGNNRLVLDLSADIEYKAFTLANPDRLVIDLTGIASLPTFKTPDLKNSTILAIRHAKRDTNVLRVALDLKHALSYKSQKLTAEDQRPHRLVFDLNTTLTPTPVSTPRPPAKATTIAKPKTQNKVEPTATKTPKSKSIMQIEKKRAVVKRDIVIAIDAGHGGQDSGAIGHKGTKEKDIVLAISKKLAKLIEKEPGMRPYLTRHKDVFIQLRHRIKRANYNHANMFISIHADAFTNTQAKGASVFVLSERGASSEAAQLLADKENAADLAGGISLDDKDNQLASVLLDLSQTASLVGSLEVANTVLSGLKRVGNVHKKHVESASFVVLKSPDIPSILVETAFISNPEEERKLKTASHQDKLARAIMSGIRAYFRRNPLPDNDQAQQHIVSRGDSLSLIAQRYQVSVAQLKKYNQLSNTLLKVGDTLLIP